VYAAPPDPPEALMDLARRMVGFAVQQRQALEQDLREQYRWAGLRRDEAMERLSRLLAASVPVTPEQAAELEELRIAMLAADEASAQHLREKLDQAGRRQRVFSRTRKALSSYLNPGPRRGLLDQRQ
jgi:hypothetical protein